MLISIFAHVFYSSLIAGVIIVLLLIFKKFSRNRFSGRVYHMMWILVLIRLMMPFEIESPYSITRIFPESSLEYMSNQPDEHFSTGIQNNSELQETNAAHYNDDKTGDYSPWNLGFFCRIWLTGILSIACFAVFVTIRFKHKSKCFQRVHDPEIISLVERYCRRLGIKKAIPIYMDSYFRSPCIFGIVNPIIFLPQNICSHIHNHQLELILLHELAHYKRKDLIYSLWAAIVTMVHWFNPLVWLAIREMRYDREIACDTYVMELLGESAVIPYGNTLIKLARMLPKHPTPLNLASFNETQKQIERRITMIKMFKKGSYKISALAIISFILIGALTLTIAGSVKQEDNPVLNANALTGHENNIVNKEIKDMLVIIDPGHGGEDFGGIYPFGITDPKLIEVKEKELNLEISLLLFDMLEKSGLRVNMTRQDDRTIEIEKRVESANNCNAAFLISVHNGMHPDESKNGTRTYYYSNSNESLQGITGEKAAQIIQSHLIEQLGTANLGISNGKFKILEQTEMCGVITEISYLTNASDRQNIITEEFKVKAAQALHNGIIEVLKIIAATNSN